MKKEYYFCPICEEKSHVSDWNKESIALYIKEQHVCEPEEYINIENEDMFCSYVCPICGIECCMNIILEQTYDEFKKTDKEEIILNKISEIWSLIKELEPHHPDEIGDFHGGIHKLQYVIGMRFARITRGDLFPVK